MRALKSVVWFFFAIFFLDPNSTQSCVCGRPSRVRARKMSGATAASAALQSDGGLQRSAAACAAEEVTASSGGLAADSIASGRPLAALPSASPAPVAPFLGAPRMGTLLTAPESHDLGPAASPALACPQGASRPALPVGPLVAPPSASPLSVPVAAANALGASPIALLGTAAGATTPMQSAATAGSTCASSAESGASERVGLPPQAVCAATAGSAAAACAATAGAAATQAAPEGAAAAPLPPKGVPGSASSAEEPAEPRRASLSARGAHEQGGAMEHARLGHAPRGLDAAEDALAPDAPACDEGGGSYAGGDCDNTYYAQSAASPHSIGGGHWGWACAATSQRARGRVRVRARDLRKPVAQPFEPGWGDGRPSGKRLVHGQTAPFGSAKLVHDARPPTYATPQPTRFARGVAAGALPPRRLSPGMPPIAVRQHAGEWITTPREPEYAMACLPEREYLVLTPIQAVECHSRSNSRATSLASSCVGSHVGSPRGAAPCALAGAAAHGAQPGAPGSSCSSDALLPAAEAVPVLRAVATCADEGAEGRMAAQMARRRHGASLGASFAAGTAVGLPGRAACATGECVGSQQQVARDAEARRAADVLCRGGCLSPSSAPTAQARAIPGAVICSDTLSAPACRSLGSEVAPSGADGEQCSTERSAVLGSASAVLGSAMGASASEIPQAPLPPPASASCQGAQEAGWPALMGSPWKRSPPDTLVSPAESSPIYSAARALVQAAVAADGSSPSALMSTISTTIGDAVGTPLRSPAIPVVPALPLDRLKDVIDPMAPLQPRQAEDTPSSLTIKIAIARPLVDEQRLRADVLSDPRTDIGARAWIRGRETRIALVHALQGCAGRSAAARAAWQAGREHRRMCLDAPSRWASTVLAGCSYKELAAQPCLEAGTRCTARLAGRLHGLHAALLSLWTAWPVECAQRVAEAAERAEACLGTAPRDVCAHVRVCATAGSETVAAGVREGAAAQSAMAAWMRSQCAQLHRSVGLGGVAMQ